MQPSVAVAFPSGENVNSQFMLSTIKLLIGNKIPISTVCNSNSSRIAFNRNILVDLAKQANSTHILFIDADTLFPQDALAKLVEYDLDIVGATASRRNDNDDAVGETFDGSRLNVSAGLTKMRLLGCPFLLIKMGVFENLRAPWFAEPPRFMMGEADSPGLMPEDEYFCHTAMKAGYDIWCDPELSLQMGHRGAKTYYIMKPQNT